MESLVNTQNIEELHEEAISENTERKAPAKPKRDVIRIDIPIDEMLAAGRAQKKQFFKRLEKMVGQNLKAIKAQREGRA